MSELLASIRQRFPCLKDLEKVERYCDRTNSLYRVKAVGYYLFSVGIPLLFVGIALSYSNQDEMLSATTSLLIMTSAACVITGLCLQILSAFPGSRCICIDWLANPTWWNKLLYALAVLSFGLLTVLLLANVGAMVFVILLDVPIFVSEATPAQTAEMANYPLAGYLALSCGLIGFIYVTGVFKTEFGSLMIRVQISKQLCGWNWRTRWWVGQSIILLGAIACLMPDMIAARRNAMPDGAAVNPLGFEPWSALAVVLLYIVFTPFIKQVEPVYDELRQQSKFQLGYILAGALLALMLVMWVTQAVPWLVCLAIAGAVLVMILFTSAYLKVLHDRKYFDIILSQGVVA